MKKIIVYAKGKIFQKYYKLIENDSIIAIVDKNAQQGEQFDRIPVYFPDKLLELEYDYVVVFSDRLFYEIVTDLVGTYFVDKEKIISWRTFLPEENVGIDYVANDIVRVLMKSIEPTSVLCIGKDGLSNHFMNKSELNLKEEVCLDKLFSKNEKIIWSIYDNVFQEIRQCKKFYDVIFLTDWQLFDENVTSKLQSDYFVIMTSYLLDGGENAWRMKAEFEKYGSVKYYMHSGGIAWLVKRNQKKTEKNDTKVYVVTHKEYNVLSNDLYTPICVGGKKLNEQWVFDSEGDNIANLNEKINECTALYWIWKNTSNEIVGLNHYRRYFFADDIQCFGNFLDASQIADILNRYDIILAEAEPFYNTTIEEQLVISTPNKDAVKKGLAIIKELLQEKQPGYYEAFCDVMQSHNFYKCNMFVTKREILNEYCEWLFSFLIEAAERIDISGYDNYSKRVIGFFAERMMTVWLYRNKLRVKELPIALW